MNRPDVITIWPRAIDYPQWRWLIKKNRKKFGKVIVSFTHNSIARDFRPFLLEACPDVTFYDTEGMEWEGDWYNTAVRLALSGVWNEWVLFLEQDFWFSDSFLERVFEIAPKYDFIAHHQYSRGFHLAFFLARKEVIDKTSKDFSHKPELQLDCFDLFGKEMMEKSKSYVSLEELGFGPEDCYHMSGLTQNYHLISIGQPQYVTGKEQFMEYNQRCFELPVKQDPEWQMLMKKAMRI